MHIEKVQSGCSHEWNGVWDSVSSGVIINAVDWNEKTVRPPPSFLPNKLYPTSKGLYFGLNSALNKHEVFES